MVAKRNTRRRFLALTTAAAAAGLAGCSGGGDGNGDGDGDGGGGDTTGTGTTSGGMDGASLRVAHVSPDAPNVDVYVDGDAVLEDVPFGAVSDYLSVSPGTYTVTITAAGDESTVAFEGDVTLEAAAYTVAAVGELTAEDSEFRPLVLEDDVSNPGSDMARVRLVHASPDGPAVDVTAAGGDVVVFDGVEFGGDDAATVEANDYTLQVRGETMGNDGEVVADFDVSLNGGTVYTAFAQGYLSPDDDPVDESFTLNVVQDAAPGS